MYKFISLLKASMTENMNLFKIYKKNQSEKSKKLLPILLFGVMFFYLYFYADSVMMSFNEVHMAYVGLTFFAFITMILTLIEGIYKSSGLLFNCKDDNLVLSLPLKKHMVLFLRVIKFYLFELLYNTMLLLPAMIAYLRYSPFTFAYLIVSLLALLLLPMIPVAVSCIIGLIISSISGIFKKKNFMQIILSTIFLLGVIYLSFNMDNLMTKMTSNALNVNNFITKIYLPAKLYISLILDFNIKDLLIFIIFNIGVLGIVVFLLSKVYFKVNSKVKKVATVTSKKEYIIKKHTPISSLIRKELNRFFTSPVFVTNAGFGLVLFIIGCVLIAFNFDNLFGNITSVMEVSINDVKSYLPLLLLGFIVATSFMTSITSSSISLEGKNFNILKSIPIKPYTIIKSKIYAATLIMLPCLLLGNIIIFIKHPMSILEIIMLLCASIILPLISETIGIIVNLKYPKMNATNDTEVVKQSISSTIAVFIGMLLIGLTIYLLVFLVNYKLAIDMIMFITVVIYSLIYLGLNLYLKKISFKSFREINV